MTLLPLFQWFEDAWVVASLTRGAQKLRTGELFHIPSEPHDSWVVGDEPYVSLHFLGAAHYAR